MGLGLETLDLARIHEGALADEAKLAKGKLHFFYQPQLSTEAELLPIAADGIELRKISAIPVTRYRYRGSNIPNPWVPETA